MLVYWKRLRTHVPAVFGHETKLSGGCVNIRIGWLMRIYIRHQTRWDPTNGRMLLVVSTLLQDKSSFLIFSKGSDLNLGESAAYRSQERVLPYLPPGICLCFCFCFQSIRSWSFSRTTWCFAFYFLQYKKKIVGIKENNRVFGDFRNRFGRVDVSPRFSHIFEMSSCSEYLIWELHHLWSSVWY